MQLKFQYVFYTSILLAFGFTDADNTTDTVEEFNNSTESVRFTGDPGNGTLTANLNLGHSHESEKRLLTAQMIFKYGDRSPIYPYEGNPWKHYNYGTVGKAPGQITCTGKQQMEELGAYVRARYKHLLDDTYNPDEIYIRSSNFERALVSISRFLSALYPPVHAGPHHGGRDGSTCVGLQSVPYHAISPSLDNLLAETAPCPRFEHLYAEFQASHIVKELNAKLDSFAVAAAMSGQSYENIPYMCMTDLYDSLSVQKIHKLAWPHWAAKIFHQTKECAELQRISEVYTAEMQRLRAGPLITELFENMLVNNWKERHTIHSPSQILAYRKAKLYVFAAHDTTIVHFLHTLGMYDGNIPGYASVVFIELHLHKRELIVEIHYKADWEATTVQLDIPRCEKPCGLKKFRETILSFILDNEAWAAECKKGPE